ncbi:ComEC/Rec2 family competence protein [Mycobacterium sp.]|uniref:ComEC/Rec2 family competence protein n=1 Tax=Mycobacterium sp. TaxID=1785 RepID=UPI003D127807
MYELDFLPVEAEDGNGTKSGDAIAGRLWLPDGTHRVIVVDAGYSAIGEDVVDHIAEYYGTNTIDLVVSTHPDGDHLNGLLTVMKSTTVRELLIHRPRHLLSAADASHFTNLEMIDAVIDEAESRGVPVSEPFTGLTRWGGALRVLGPSVEYYEYLVGLHVSEERSGIGEAKRTVAKVLSSAIAAAGGFRAGALPYLPEETLEDNPVTSHRNNTSAVLLLESIDGQRILLTGDAGVPALSLAAAEYELRIGTFTDQPLSVFQVPHHGSHHNSAPSLLDRFIGPQGSFNTLDAVVSSAKASPHHPSPKVTNALLRRGAKVVSTEGKTICAYSGPSRIGWVPAPSMPPRHEDN